MASRYVLVIGCGRIGSTVASELSQRGDSVVVIDTEESAFSNLSAEFSGFRILGDAAEVSVLREAKAEDADFVCAATDRDNLNLMVAQAARELFGVPLVAARIFDPSREAVFREFGISTISPTVLTGQAFLTLLGATGEADR